MTLRLGLDVHGVIDDDPELFSGISSLMHQRGCKVYIVTGREISDELKVELAKSRIVYDKILSITTYRKVRGLPIFYVGGDKSQPMMEPYFWDRTKAKLCAEANIDLMIDDSLVYGEFFRDIETQYIIYNAKAKEFLRTLFYYGEGE